VVFVVEAFDRRVLDRAVHPLNLTIGPRVVGLGQSVLDPIRLADHVETHRPGVDGVPIAGLLGELDTVVSENRVDPIGHGLEHVLEELPGCLSVSFCTEFNNGELGRPVDADEHVELAFGRLHFCDVDVKEADGVALELLPLGLVTLDIRQPRDAMALKTAMQRRPGQMRDRRLQGIEAIIKRKQRMLATFGVV